MWFQYGGYCIALCWVLMFIFAFWGLSSTFDIGGIQTFSFRISLSSFLTVMSLNCCWAFSGSKANNGGWQDLADWLDGILLCYLYMKLKYVSKVGAGYNLLDILLQNMWFSRLCHGLLEELLKADIVFPSSAWSVKVVCSISLTWCQGNKAGHYRAFYTFVVDLLVFRVGEWSAFTCCDILTEAEVCINQANIDWCESFRQAIDKYWIIGPQLWCSMSWLVEILPVAHLSRFNSPDCPIPEHGRLCETQESNEGQVSASNWSLWTKGHSSWDSSTFGMTKSGWMC